MSTVLKTANETKELKSQVRDFLQEVLDRRIVSQKDTPIIRREFSCSPVDPVVWLHNQKVDVKAYWADRDDEFQMGGIQSADCIEDNKDISYQKLFEHCQANLSLHYPNLRYYGGLSFHDQKSSSEWQSYGKYRFIIPQFEVLRSKSKTIFAVNVLQKDFNEEKRNEYLEKLDQINFEEETKYKAVPKVLSRFDLPDRERWDQLCRRILDSEMERLYEKIVLARKSVFRFDVPINPVALVKHLRDMTPRCFHFCFQLSDNEGFLGATPERLIKIKGNEIQTEAIAGTIARGETPEEDTALESKLLSSEKNAREHKFVVEQIKSILDKFCVSVNVDESFSLMKLKGGQHLVTRINGVTKDGIKAEAILPFLHPTPAVAGSPTQASLAAINEMEPFSRGWYAGPVGYIGHDTSELAVGIRSGLVSQHTLSLYAGAGIVKGSTSNDEWNEIENKISRFIKVFDV